MVDQRGHGHTSCPHQAPGPPRAVVRVVVVTRISEDCVHPLVFAHRKHRPCTSTRHTPCALLHGKLLELHPSPLSSWTLWPCCCWAGLLSAERGQAERGTGTGAGRTEAPLLSRLGVEWGEAAGGLGRQGSDLQQGSPSLDPSYRRGTGIPTSPALQESSRLVSQQTPPESISVPTSCCPWGVHRPVCTWQGACRELGFGTQH